MRLEIERMLRAYEGGRIGRRGLIARLGALVAALSGVERLAGSADEGESTFRASGLNHVALRVKDVGRARDFYRKHLGLEILRDGESSSFLRCGDDFVALFRATEPGLHHYCYTIEGYEPEAVMRRLEAHGLAPRREENRVYFADPEGLTVQVSAENDWRDWEWRRGLGMPD